MKLLIVEDKVKMASLLRRAMRGEGVAADVAVTGEDALWMAGATRYDAIVLDVMLPGIDGIDTCQRLRADGVWTPVLMLTASASASDSRSSAPSPKHTAVGRKPRTVRAAAPTCGSPCRKRPIEPGRASPTR
jgi:CheY-like chemotaxis protein